MIVLRVKVNGDEKYVKGIPSIYNPKCFVDSPWDATKFKTDDPNTCGDLRETLGWLRVSGDKLYAPRGIEVDEVPEIVTFKLHCEEIATKPSRAEMAAVAA